MRIIAGQYRNHRIQVPKRKSIDPISGMMREALFNLLGSDVVDACIADCFAGSGSLCLEALSRGAQRVTFIDNKKEATQVISGNAVSMGVSPDRYRIWNSDVLHLPNSDSEWAHWNLVLLDPPRVIPRNFLDGMARRGVIHPDCLLVLHRQNDCVSPDESEWIQILERRSYGRGEWSFWRVLSNERK